MSSSELSHHLRVNKRVDRMMFLDVLSTVDIAYPLKKYAYVGLPGAYYEDFKAVHLRTGIQSMYAIEMNEKVLKRQKYNKPYSFIRSAGVAETCEQAISKIDSIRTMFSREASNLVVWLDYDLASKRREQLQELENLLLNCIHGDVVRITLNANRAQLGAAQVYQNLQDKADWETVNHWRLDNLKQKLGDFLPDERDTVEAVESDHDFAFTLISCVKHRAACAIQGKADLTIYPLLCTAYADGQQMVTASFIVLNRKKLAEFKKLTRYATRPDSPGNNWNSFVKINIPALSSEERHQLQRRLNRKRLRVRKDDFLEKDELQQYLLHYRRYPVFAAVEIA